VSQELGVSDVSSLADAMKQFALTGGKKKTPPPAPSVGESVRSARGPLTARRAADTPRVSSPVRLFDGSLKSLLKPVGESRHGEDQEYDEYDDDEEEEEEEVPDYRPGKHQDKDEEEEEEEGFDAVVNPVQAVRPGGRGGMGTGTRRSVGSEAAPQSVDPRHDIGMGFEPDWGFNEEEGAGPSGGDESAPRGLGRGEEDQSRINKLKGQLKKEAAIPPQSAPAHTATATAEETESGVESATLRILSISVSNVPSVESLGGKNDLFVDISQSSLWKTRTDVKSEAGAAASWDVSASSGFSYAVSGADLRNKMLLVAVNDKNDWKKDVFIGKAEGNLHEALATQSGAYEGGACSLQLSLLDDQGDQAGHAVVTFRLEGIVRKQAAQPVAGTPVATTAIETSGLGAVAAAAGKEAAGSDSLYFDEHDQIAGGGLG
jgi:hypothetical protein